jgi:acetyl-CoA acetyltransferase
MAEDVWILGNPCATGATALRTAILATKAGECEMGLAIGVEKLAGAVSWDTLVQRRDRRRRRHRRVDTAPSLPLTVASAPRPCRARSPRSAWSTGTVTAA